MNPIAKFHLHNFSSSKNDCLILIGKFKEGTFQKGAIISLEGRKSSLEVKILNHQLAFGMSEQRIVKDSTIRRETLGSDLLEVALNPSIISSELKSKNLGTIRPIYAAK